jgi:transposase
MKQFPPEQKHSILLEYTPRSTTHSFAALAARHGVAGGGNTLQLWHQRWDGTVASLQHKPVSGRPRVLSRREVQQHVRTPILRANRAHKAVHYPALLAPLQQKTGKEVSLRTVQRYGKEELGARQRRGKKRTTEESQYTHT